MTDLDKPVVRRTAYVAHGKKVIVTLAPGGVFVRLERERTEHKVSWDKLWAAALTLPGPVR